jgi:hypothetical protein
MTKITKKRKESQLERIDDNMLYGSLGILDGVLDFSDIDPESEEPPKEWIDKFGATDAWKRFRLAKVGWLPNRSLPSGVKIAATLVTEVLKAKMMAQSMKSEKKTQPLRKSEVRSSDAETVVEEFEEIQVDE